MPTLSASDYTTYLKFKAAAASAIRPAIQTRDNVATNQSIINANTLTSQAAYVVTPYSRRVVTSPGAVTDASINTITVARTDIVTAAVGGGDVITYTTSQPHGLTTGTVVSIRDLTQNTLNTSPNVSSATVTRLTDTTFTVPATGSAGAASGTGRIDGRAYYTTTVAHGLVAGMTVTITNITTFAISNASVLAAPSATTFVLSNTATGTVTSAAGTISGYVYYTTSAAHGLTAGTQNVTITGLSTSAFNLTLVTATLVPSSTVFAVQSTATGTEVTGAAGVLTVTYFANTATSLRNNARVVGLPEVQTRSTNKAKSTLSWTSGTSGSVSSTSSSKIQQPGGLPRKGVVGTYTRLPQSAGWGT